MKKTSYGGRVNLIHRVKDADGFDAKLRALIEEFLDHNNEVRVVLVGETINIIQHPVERLAPPPKNYCDVMSGRLHFGKKKKKHDARKLKPQIATPPDVPVTDLTFIAPAQEATP